MICTSYMFVYTRKKVIKVIKQNLASFAYLKEK